MLHGNWQIEEPQTSVKDVDISPALVSIKTMTKEELKQLSVACLHASKLHLPEGSVIYYADLLNILNSHCDTAQVTLNENNTITYEEF